MRMAAPTIILLLLLRLIIIVIILLVEVVSAKPKAIINVSVAMAKQERETRRLE